MLIRRAIINSSHMTRDHLFFRGSELAVRPRRLALRRSVHRDDGEVDAYILINRVSRAIAILSARSCIMSRSCRRALQLISYSMPQLRPCLAVSVFDVLRFLKR